MSQAASSRTQPPPESPEGNATIAPINATDAGTSSRAAIQTWTGKAIREQIHAKSLGDAYGKWLFHRATRQPVLRDMYVKSSNIYEDTLLNLKIGDEHVTVSQSDSYVRNLGQDLRGLCLSELKFATANSLRDLFDECLAKKQPIYARFISSLSAQSAYWEALILPLSAQQGGPPIFTMSYMAMLSEKIDVLQILYDRSPVGIIAAVPIMDGQNKTDDARILTMNTKARQILRLDPKRSQLHTVGELIRFLGATLQWSGTGTSIEGQVTRIGYRNPEGDAFSMSIEMINQLILISIAESAPQQPDVKTTSRFARLLGLS